MRLIKLVCHFNKMPQCSNLNVSLDPPNHESADFLPIASYCVAPKLHTQKGIVFPSHPQHWKHYGVLIKYKTLLITVLILI